MLTAYNTVSKNYHVLQFWVNKVREFSKYLSNFGSSIYLWNLCEPISMENGLFTHPPWNQQWWKLRSRESRYFSECKNVHNFGSLNCSLRSSLDWNFQHFWWKITKIFAWTKNQVVQQPLRAIFYRRTG